MSTRTKIFAAVGIVTLLVIMLAAGGWLVNTTFAQGPWQGGFMGMGHNNQAVLDLLKASESDLLKERQAGKSWLEIAAAKGVTEQALTDALLQSVNQMHGWMSQYYPQSNVAPMTEWMRQQIGQDIRAAQYGTMTDLRVLGGSPANNYGMMNGYGMMGRSPNGYGMMGGWRMGGGMMGGWNNAPNVNATPIPSTQKVDQEISLTVSNFKFDPPSVTVKKGQTVKFNISNQDNFAHNAVSRDGNLAYTVLAANQTTSILWSAPDASGTYTVFCTWHPGMQFTIVVE